MLCPTVPLQFRPSRRHRSHWHDPEHLAGQAQRDAQLGRNQFFVYVLATIRGHYVGHTWNVRSRLRQHQAGEVPSTQGSDPKLLWQSRSFQTRQDAASFEAAIKSLRDQRSERYAEIVGYDPQPFQSPFRPRRPRTTRWPGCLLPIIALAAMLFLVAIAIAG